MTTPLVSILVPVYNDSAFLLQALVSIANQTWKEFEVIISDDCSTDDSRSIATEFTRRDPRFRLVTNPANLGMTRNWNRALHEAQGLYVAKLDSDDAFRPRFLEEMIGIMEGDTKPVVVYCRALSCDEHLEPFASYLGEQGLIRARIDPLATHCRAGHEWFRLSFDDIQLWHSNAQLHRREVLMQMGGWDESWGCASDTDLILRVLEHNELICHIPYAGVLYRHRAGSVSEQYRRSAWLRWESCLIHLNSLSRYHQSDGRLGRTLRKAWWRYWRNWTDLRQEGNAALSDLRVDARERLLQRAARTPAAPLSIVAEGRIRQWIWNRLPR